MIAKRTIFASCFLVLGACSARLSVTTGDGDHRDSGLGTADGETTDQHPDGATAMPPAMSDDAGSDAACMLSPPPFPRCPLVLRPCQCASSADLMPIACGVNVDGLLNVAHPGANGSVAALTLCNDDGCDAYYWTAAGVERLAVTAVAVALAADGTTVLVSGRAEEPHTGQFLWRKGGTTTEIPLVSVHAVSDDAAIVLGTLPGVTGRFARWTSQKGTVGIGNPSSLYSGGPLMTPDGSFVAGQRDDAPGSHLARWSATGQELLLGASPNGAVAANSYAMSNAGAVIAGATFGSTGASDVFRWTEASGMVAIAKGFPPGDVRMSPDGAVLFATYMPEDAGNTPRAFRWTAASGVAALPGSPPEGSVLRNISADASVAVGYTLDNERHPAFVWSEATGIRALADVLGGVDMGGWELGPPIGLSADGHVLFGQGTCNGVGAVYRVVLP